jgi:hypothetical protein
VQQLSRLSAATTSDRRSSGSGSASTPASAEAAALLAARRAALAALRERLNRDAAAKLEGLLAAALGRPHAGPKQA